MTYKNLINKILILPAWKISLFVFSCLVTILGVGYVILETEIYILLIMGFPLLIPLVVFQYNVLERIVFGKPENDTRIKHKPLTILLTLLNICLLILVGWYSLAFFVIGSMIFLI